MVEHHVERAGENMDTWKKVILAARFGLLTTAWMDAVDARFGLGTTAWTDVIGWGLGIGGKLRVQRCVVGVRYPVRATWPLCLMVTVVAVKCAVQPWSQSWLMETRELEAKLGKMWAWQALGGRKGKQRSAVWVDVMVFPSGMRTLIPWLARHLL
jgi:hypothetical protein